MPTLENIQGSSLAINLDSLINRFARNREEERSTQLQQELLGLSRTAAGLPGVSGELPTSQQSTDAQIRIATLNPQLSQAVQQVVESGNQRRIQLSKDMVEQVGRDAIQLQSITDTVKRQQEITRLAAKAQVDGRSIDHLITLSNSSPEEQDLILQKQIITAADAGEVFNDALKVVGTKAVLNTATGQEEFATNQEIAANDNLVPVPGRDSPLVQIGLGDDSFKKQLGKGLGDRITSMVEVGQEAISSQQNLVQMASILSGPDITTGSLQPLVTNLQGVASDLGVDLQGVASALGINLGKLSTQQEFHRLSRNVMLSAFKNVKGNMNSKEVDIVEDSVANLGTSKEANIDAVASLQASYEIARIRAIEASNVSTIEEAKALQKETFSGDAKLFKELKDNFKTEMIGKTTVPPGVPEGSVRLDNPTAAGETVWRDPEGEFWIVD